MSFLQRIYKERYFPNWSFIEATLGPNLSFAWRAIWETQKLLKLGQKWWMGDGRSIKIWKDRWMLEFDTLNPYSNVKMENGWDDTIDTLLDTNFKWDV